MPYRCHHSTSFQHDPTKHKVAEKANLCSSSTCSASAKISIEAISVFPTSHHFPSDLAPLSRTDSYGLVLHALVGTSPDVNDILGTLLDNVMNISSFMTIPTLLFRAAPLLTSVLPNFPKWVGSVVSLTFLSAERRLCRKYVLDTSSLLCLHCQSVTDSSGFTFFPPSRSIQLSRPPQQPYNWTSKSSFMSSTHTQSLNSR